MLPSGFDASLGEAASESSTSLRSRFKPASCLSQEDLNGKNEELWAKKVGVGFKGSAGRGACC